MQTIQDKSGGGVVTLPKDEPERDGYLDDGDISDDQNLLVERLGEGEHHLLPERFERWFRFVEFERSRDVGL